MSDTSLAEEKAVTQERDEERIHRRKVYIEGAQCYTTRDEEGWRIHDAGLEAVARSSVEKARQTIVKEVADIQRAIYEPEITALRAEVARLKEALEKIRDLCQVTNSSFAFVATEIARTALNPPTTL